MRRTKKKMREVITNEVIAERIDNFKEDVNLRFDQVDEHLRKLNSQTEKNTRFRIGAVASLKVLGFLTGGGLLGYIIKMLIQ